MILFYSPRDEYGCFSNFARFGFFDSKERWYPTSEHFYQAFKHYGSDRFELVRNAQSPKQAAILGRDHNFFMRADWELVKVHVMMAALRFKFKANPHIRNKLIETRNELLIEASPKDRFWGWGPDHNGYNMLGQLLMILREEFRVNISD